MPSDTEYMGRWFARVTKPQLARYNERMRDAFPYMNTPKWDRLRQAAHNEFEQTTTSARLLYERAMADLAAWDEISEETDEALTAFERGEVFAIAAE